MNVGRVDFSAWIVRLITWDGLVPVFMALAPSAVGLSIPNNRGVMEATAVALPIAAFFVRFGVGFRLIQTNNCAAEIRRFQVVAFVFGMFLLLFFDSVSILAHVMPSGALFPRWTDFLGFMIVFGSVYLVAMAISLYLGPVWKLDFSWAWKA